MSDIRDFQTPEMVAWVRSVVAPMIQEKVEEIVCRDIREDGLGRLERSFAASQVNTEERFDRLEVVLVELAEAQRRTDERLGELIEAQKRTDERLGELAEAQRQTEKQVAQLAATQQMVLERLDKLDHRVESLDHRMGSVEHQVGLIGNVLGVEAEAEAQEALVYVLEQKGYRLLEVPYALAVNGEVDVVVQAETPEGERVCVLVDVKARARLKELRRWSSRLRDEAFQQRLADAGLTKPFLPYFFGLRVYQIVDAEARELGIGVLDPDGERVTPALLQ